MSFIAGYIAAMNDCPQDKQKKITENGEYIPIDSIRWSKVSVDVTEGGGDNPDLEFVARSEFSKVLVTVPIDDVYHYTVNLVWFDGSHFIPGTNLTIPGLRENIGIECDEYTPNVNVVNAVLPVFTGIHIYLVAWKNNKPVYAYMWGEGKSYTNEFDYGNYYFDESASYKRRRYYYYKGKYDVRWETFNGGGGGVTWMGTYRTESNDGGTSTYFMLDSPYFKLSEISFGGAVTYRTFSYDNSSNTLTCTGMETTPVLVSLRDVSFSMVGYKYANGYITDNLTPKALGEIMGEFMDAVTRSQAVVTYTERPKVLEIPPIPPL